DRRTLLSPGAGLAGALALSPALRAARVLGPGREPVEVALVGAGKQGRAILGELGKLERVRVVAVCDTSDSRLKSGLRRVRDAAGYATHDELLAAHPALRAVFVATPTHLHRRVVVDALAAGKSVFCEAPFASTLDDARAMARAARGAQGVLAVGMQGRSNPIYGLARNFVRAGAIGGVAALRAQMHRKTSWRTPVADASEEQALNWVLDPAVSLGLIGEFGVQQFDVLHWFLEAYPTRVRARGSIQLHDDGRELSDTVSAELVFPKGQVLAWDATLANSFDGQHEQLCGAMGTVKLAWTAGWLFKEADAPTQGWEVYANRQQFHDEQGITLIADATKLAAQNKLKEGVGLPNPPLYYALEDFLASALDGEPVACTAEEGLRALAVGLAAVRALREGGEVEVDAADLLVE
ncbi:MAG TPA: Gfo/Idh/MocA family oxidoreductase, partial [Planctomycetota bacterium]|nr:Gfo/Idh/MocA family oxidoreductase [Planctomycetota bacterium]